MDTQSLTQTVNIIVGGEGSGLASTGMPLLPLLAAGLALVTFSILAWRYASRRSHKLSFRSLGIFTLLAIGATSLAFNLPGASAAAILTLGTNQDTLTVNVPKGGGTASTTTTLTSSTTNPSGYKLTASLNEPEAGVAIKLSGGDVTTSTALAAGGTPLTLKTTNSATSNNTTDITLEFTIDGSVTPGTKNLKLAYVATDNGSSTPTTLQSMTTSYCSSMSVYDGSNEAAVLELSDPRGDGQTYRVAKLADNNCWMLDNLRLGSTTGTTALTPADTNIAASSSFILPQLYDGTDSSYLSADVPFAYGPVLGDDIVVKNDNETNYGYLYNWSAATAGESRASHDETKGNAEFSICPANWRLPTGGEYNSGDGEFAALDVAFGGTGMEAYNGEPNIAKWQHDGPFKGTLAGYWYEGFGGQGGSGILWSSSASPGGAGYALYAYFYAAGVSPGGEDDRGGGVAVRCLLN